VHIAEVVLADVGGQSEPGRFGLVVGQEADGASECPPEPISGRPFHIARLGGARGSRSHGGLGICPVLYVVPAGALR
jgi:hypothetical protein